MRLEQEPNSNREKPKTHVEVIKDDLSSTPTCKKKHMSDGEVVRAAQPGCLVRSEARRRVPSFKQMREKEKHEKLEQKHKKRLSLAKALFRFKFSSLLF